MTHRIEKLNDRWFRFIGIPLIALVSHVVFFNEQQGSADEGFAFWEVYLIAVAEAVVLWEVNRLVLLYFRKRYPSFRQSRQRIIGELAGCLLATVAAARQAGIDPEAALRRATLAYAEAIRAAERPTPTNPA